MIQNQLIKFQRTDWEFDVNVVEVVGVGENHVSMKSFLKL